MRGQKAVEELQKESGKIRHLTLREVAGLDPFGRRVESIREKAEGFLGQENDKKDQFLFGLNKEFDEIFSNRVESDPSQYLQFWQTTFRDFWSVTDKNILNKAGTKPELISPEQINYQTKSQDIDTTKFGEYTLNPETQNIDWEAIPDNKIKVIDPTAEGITGKRYEVIQQIIQKYGSTHYFPGIEYWKYILENPAKAPDSLKDEKYHFFIGSIFRYSVGRWVVPYASWGGAVFLRHGYWLDDDWDSVGRVVLLER